MKFNCSQNMETQPPHSSENIIYFCSVCGCNEFREIVVAYEEHYVSENEIRCKKCDKLTNYWSYGFYENEKMLRTKKLERICHH